MRRPRSSRARLPYPESPPGSLDPDFISYAGSHQPDVFQRCADGFACRRRAKARRGFDEGRTNLQGNLAKLFLFVIGQIAVFKDDLACQTIRIADFDDSPHLFFHVIPMAAFQFHKVDDIIDFIRAFSDDILGFKYLGFDRTLTQRKGYGGVYQYAGILPELPCRRGLAHC